MHCFIIFFSYLMKFHYICSAFIHKFHHYPWFWNPCHHLSVAYSRSFPRLFYLSLRISSSCSFDHLSRLSFIFIYPYIFTHILPCALYMYAYIYIYITRSLTISLYISALCSHLLYLIFTFFLSLYIYIYITSPMYLCFMFLLASILSTFPHFLPSLSL